MTRAAADDRGFSLIELMVTLSVLSILLALAVPSFRNAILDNRRAAAVNELVAALSLARTEALVRRRPVTLCRSNNSLEDDPICGTGAGFEAGWVVFAETDEAGTVGTIDADDVLLRQLGPLPPGITARGNVNVANRITYRATGSLDPATVGTIFFCDERGAVDEAGTAHGRRVIVSVAGRVRIDTTTAALGCGL